MYWDVSEYMCVGLYIYVCVCMYVCGCVCVCVSTYTMRVYESSTMAPLFALIEQEENKFLQHFQTVQYKRILHPSIPFMTGLHLKYNIYSKTDNVHIK